MKLEMLTVLLWNWKASGEEECLRPRCRIIIATEKAWVATVVESSGWTEVFTGGPPPPCQQKARARSIVDRVSPICITTTTLLVAPVVAHWT